MQHSRLGPAVSTGWVDSPAAVAASGQAETLIVRLKLPPRNPIIGRLGGRI